MSSIDRASNEKQKVFLPAPVKATLVDDIDQQQDLPGAFGFYVVQDTGDQPRGMIYTCTCGCKRQGALTFRPQTEDDIKYKRASWEWDGNREAPTLSPSVHHVGHWHGYLKAGFWTQA